jgi:ubiquinone/menaquinone biosynthesis C-methylase UbiE
MWIPERLYSWWWGRRVPEAEAMDSEEEVQAYAGAAAQRYLARLDEDAACRAALLFRRCRRVIDLGCGPAAIPLSVAARVPGLQVIGVDLSVPMLRQARIAASQRGIGERLSLVCANASALPFRDVCFDAACSNSLIHHLARPQQAMRELSRVTSPGAAMFLRDLRRPSRILLLPHLAIFGRWYRGQMRRLFEASVRAAYTKRELRELLRSFGRFRVARRGGAHVEAVRAAMD